MQVPVVIVGPVAARLARGERSVQVIMGNRRRRKEGAALLMVVLVWGWHRGGETQYSELSSLLATLLAQQKRRLFHKHVPSQGTHSNAFPQEIFSCSWDHIQKCPMQNSTFS